jgi:hypothetical protein
VTQAKEMKFKAKRDGGADVSGNKSSEHFDIISLQYHNTSAGSRLKQHVGGSSGAALTACCRVGQLACVQR